MKDFYFKGVKVTSCNMRSATAFVVDSYRKSKCEYICVIDAGHIVVASRRSPLLKEAINNSALCIPDGRPLSIFARLKGDIEIERVAGPDFMTNVLKSTEGHRISHFFMGDTEEALERLVCKIRREFPNITISGWFSPPFGEWGDDINMQILSKIRESNPDFIWVSLGNTKQAVWMYRNHDKLKHGVIVGVGAAFRFYLGDIKRAPKFFQFIALEWFFRLLQQPRKMGIRYLRTLPLFILYFIQELFKRNKI
ncbi:MAG: WecB/TagA/CpsF family glycosyltransferase [Bacteroidota bacterium]